MILGDVLNRLRKKVLDKQDKISAALSSGKCSDYAEYRYRTGEYKGLSDIEDMIKEVLKEFNEEEDKD